jgi:Uma2 family endonuclease
LPLHEQVTELQPDVLVARHADFTDRDLPTAPLLAVEVLSPGTRLIDLNLKRAAYERMGTASFWLIDPKSVELWAYDLYDDGSHGQVAHVIGEQAFEARRRVVLRSRLGVDDDQVAIMWQTDVIMTVTVIIIGWRVGTA